MVQLDAEKTFVDISLFESIVIKASVVSIMSTCPAIATQASAILLLEKLQH